MSQPSAKEIAERITNADHTYAIWPPESIDLARAYLELEKERMVCPACGEEVSTDQKINMAHNIIVYESEITKLKEELAAEKADKQRVLDIGVKMQREVNDRVEAKNAGLIEALNKIITLSTYAGKITPDVEKYMKNRIATYAPQIASDAIKKWGGV